MFDAMPSSEPVSSSRKCRRLPNITSRMTIRLQRSPSISSVRLIGHPERCAAFMGVSLSLAHVLIGEPAATSPGHARNTTCNIQAVLLACNQLLIAISEGTRDVVDALCPPVLVVLPEG